jgi:hypothetical protein
MNRRTLGKFNNGKSCALCAGSQQKAPAPVIAHRGRTPNLFA